MHEYDFPELTALNHGVCRIGHAAVSAQFKFDELFDFDWLRSQRRVLPLSRLTEPLNDSIERESIQFVCNAPQVPRVCQEFWQRYGTAQHLQKI